MGLHTVCIFAGSAPGARPVYVAVARALGELCARRELRIVYGGGGAGLMGALADGALAAGGEVIGVMPRSLIDREAAHRGITELQCVETMAERKARMAELSGGFIALPGGIGTLEEIVEVVSWARLRLHAKPSALLDVEGFWAPFGALLDAFVAEGFLPAGDRDLLAIAGSPAAALDVLAAG